MYIVDWFVVNQAVGVFILVVLHHVLVGPYIFYRKIGLYSLLKTFRSPIITYIDICWSLFDICFIRNHALLLVKIIDYLSLSVFRFL